MLNGQLSPEARTMLDTQYRHRWWWNDEHHAQTLIANREKEERGEAESEVHQC